MTTSFNLTPEEFANMFAEQIKRDPKMRNATSTNIDVEVLTENGYVKPQSFKFTVSIDGVSIVS
jgi:hypothetical protein